MEYKYYNQFIANCVNGNLNRAKMLYSLGNINIHMDNEYAFRKSCQSGYLDVAKWLYSLGNINIHIDDEFAFRWSCENGHLDVAQWLYSLGNINIHIDDEYAFRWSCFYGHLDVAKWLYSLGNINIHKNDEHAFCYACRLGNVEIAKWLASINNMYFIVIEDNEIIEWKILNTIDIYVENKEFTKIITFLNIKKEQHNLTNIECPICYDKTPDLTVKTICGHIFCIKCILIVKNLNSTCPVCRTDMEYFSYDLHI